MRITLYWLCLPFFNVFPISPHAASPHDSFVALLNFLNNIFCNYGPILTKPYYLSTRSILLCDLYMKVSISLKVFHILWVLLVLLFDITHRHIHLIDYTQGPIYCHTDKQRNICQHQLCPWEVCPTKGPSAKSYQATRFSVSFSMIPVFDSKMKYFCTYTKQ